MPRMSVAVRRAMANSKAVDESNPRVALGPLSDSGKRRTRFNSLVPAIDQPTTGERLCNGDPFLLTTGQTAEGLVADLGVPAVFQTEDGHQGIRDVVYVVLPGHIGDTSVRGTGLCSESERFLHCECGEMDIFFRDELRIQGIRARAEEMGRRSGPVGHHESVPLSRLE